MHGDKNGEKDQLRQEIEALRRENSKLQETLTQREKYLQKEINRQKRRFEDISAAAGEYIWEVDNNGHYTFLSDLVQQVLGYSKEELLGRTPFEFIPEEDKPEVIEKFAEAKDNYTPFNNLQHRSITKDNKIIWQNVTGLPLLGEKGELTGYRGTAQDITEKKVALDRLAEDEKKSRAMSEASYDAVIGIDSYGTIEFWNPAAKDMFGYSEKEAMGQDLHDLIATPADRNKAKQGLPSFAKSGKGKVVNSIMEMTGAHKNGKTFPVERSVTSYKIRDIWHAVGIVRDITARKESEKQLKFLATTDGLTTLWNRRHFMELAEKELQRCIRYQRPLSLIMLDIDHFKFVNDTYGHDTGDIVLKYLAGILKPFVREQDILARLGGEEFVCFRKPSLQGRKPWLNVSAKKLPKKK